MVLTCSFKQSIYLINLTKWLHINYLFNRGFGVGKYILGKNCNCGYDQWWSKIYSLPLKSSLESSLFYFNVLISVPSSQFALVVVIPNNANANIPKLLLSFSLERISVNFHYHYLFFWRLNVLLPRFFFTKKQKVEMLVQLFKSKK